MTKKAIVFDNSGTLLERFRVIKDVSTGELITHVNSLDLIDTCLNAALVVLQFNTTRLKDLDPNTLISDFVLENNIEFDISYYSTDVSKEEITAILEKDTAIIKDITDTFPLLKERVPQMELCNGSAVIIDIAEERIAYTITSAGQLFSGVKDTIAKLQDKDIDVFVGDGPNDILAFEQADSAVLTTEQKDGDFPDKLKRYADFVIEDISEVLQIDF